MASEEHNLLVQALLTDKMSQLFSRQGDLKRAIDYLELSCDQFQQVGNPSWLAQGLVKWPFSTGKRATTIWPYPYF